MPPFVNIAYAAAPGNVVELVSKINQILINPFIMLLFAVALLVFIAGVVQFVAVRDKSSENAEKGKQHMLWGIIGMFIMVSVFGIIRIIINTFGIDLPDDPSTFIR